jgi:hypothetical protein
MKKTTVAAQGSNPIHKKKILFGPACAEIKSKSLNPNKLREGCQNPHVGFLSGIFSPNRDDF